MEVQFTANQRAFIQQAIRAVASAVPKRPLNRHFRYAKNVNALALKSERLSVWRKHLSHAAKAAR